MEKIIWHTEQRKISDLIPWAKNPRRITQKQYNDLYASLEKFNIVEIPVIDIDNTVVGFHQRATILAKMGRGDEITDVRVPNRKLTESELAELNIRLNKNTAEWDHEKLANFFDLDDLQSFGFEKWELGLVDHVNPDDFLVAKPESTREIDEKENCVKCPSCGYEFEG